MSRGRGGKEQSQRQLRVSEEIRYALAWILERGDLRDPVLSQVHLTVTDVRISPDLRNATAFITPLGGGDVRPILEALKRAQPFFRHELARRVEMKFIPQIRFRADELFEEANRINQLMNRPEVLRDTHPDALTEGDERTENEDGDGA